MKTMLSNPQSLKLHDYLERAYYRLGLFIGRHASWLIICSLLFVSVALTGLWRLQMRDKVRHGYTPDEAPSEQENRVYVEFFNQTDVPTGLGIFIEATDNGNLLREQTLSDAVDFIVYLTENFTVEENGVTFGYNDLCAPRCAMNGALIAFTQLLRQSVFGGFTNSTPFTLDYPTALIGGVVEVPIYTALFGVKTADDPDYVEPANQSEFDHLLSRITNMRSAQVAVMWFLSGTTQTELAEKWENLLFDQVASSTFSSSLKIHVYGDETVNREVLRGGMGAGKYIGGGTLLMSSFVLATVVAASMINGQMCWQKLVLVVVAITSPLLAVATAFSIIVWSGAQVTAFMCMTPVLILGIGVDDAFLLMHSWLRFGNDPAFGRLPIQERVALVLRDVGPSMSITSLTNSLAFAVGILTPVHQIRMFSLVTAMSVVIDFGLQLFFFTSTIALVHRHQSGTNKTNEPNFEKEPLNGESVMAVTTEKPVKSPDSPDLNANSPCVNNRNLVDDLVAEMEMQKTVVEKKHDVEEWTEPSVDFEQPLITKYLLVYCQFICTNICRVLAILILIALWTIAYFGVAKMRPSFTLSKTLPYGSPMADASEVVQNQVWKENYGVLVIVNRPPNITNTTDLEGYMTLVHRFEALPNQLGPSGHMMWLVPYVQYFRATTSFFDFFDTGDDPLDYSLVPDFLELPQFQKYNRFVRWEKDERNQVVVKSFASMVFFANMSEWATRADSYMTWRAVVSDYKEYNVTLWEYDGAIFDLIMQVPDITIRSILITLGCMSIVCVFFVPNITCVTAAIFTVMSITYVMTGLLSFWGADLDPIVMLNIIMSVGFNVDYTAHVTYHFYKSGITHHNMAERLAVTIAAVAFPMLQAGGSTLLCVLLMILNQVYAYTLFVKSIALVVVFGVLHGLFILPCLLAVFPTAITSPAGKKALSPPSREMATVT